MSRRLILLAVLVVAACARPPVKPAVADMPRPAAPTVVPATPPEIDPASFFGMDDTRLQHTLGAPPLRRPEGDGELWRYVSGDCAAVFILYRDADARLRVAHAETVPLRDTRPVPARCLGELAAAAAPETAP